MTRYTIRYSYGGYSGTETVIMSGDEHESPIDKMWRQLRPHLSLGMAARGAKIVSADEIDEGEDQ